MKKSVSNKFAGPLKNPSIGVNAKMGLFSWHYLQTYIIKNAPPAINPRIAYKSISAPICHAPGPSKYGPLEKVALEM